jgi:type VI secretion system secreted protein Hcp
MAVDMFLKLDSIKGESIDKVHKDEINVLAWSWGVTQSGSTHISAGSGSGKANFQDISFTKYIDKASVDLLKHCANGKHIKDALLTVRKAGGTPLEYVTIKIQDILVSSISTGGSGGEDRLTENVTLNFAKVNFDYIAQKSDGTGEPAAIFAWNIPANAEA